MNKLILIAILLITVANISQNCDEPVPVPTATPTATETALLNDQL